jgi:hypothetical protein
MHVRRGAQQIISFPYYIFLYNYMLVAFYLRRAIHNYLIFFTIKKRLSCV